MNLGQLQLVATPVAELPYTLFIECQACQHKTWIVLQRLSSALPSASVLLTAGVRQWQWLLTKYENGH